MVSIQVASVAANGNLRSIIGAWSSLQLVLRHRRGGTWTLSGPASSGLPVMTPATRVEIRRGGALICAGPVTRIEDERSEDGRTLTVSGIDDIGQLADRVTTPVPAAALTDQTAAAYWTDSGSAEFVIHRLVTRNAGLGARPARVLYDSRVGTSVRVNPGNGATGWTNASDGGVTWSGQTATVPNGEAMRLRMTNAINLSGSNFLTLASNLTVSGSSNITVNAYFNTTAAGAAPGQSGVVTELYVIHAAANISGATTLWAAEVLRPRESGKTWCRLEIGVGASGASRTVTLNAGGGVWQKAGVGSNVRVNSRFKNLADEVDELAAAGGVVLASDYSDSLPRLLVRAPTDRTASARLSRDYGNLLSSRTVLAAPSGTIVLVAGSGEGTARVIRTRENTQAATEWGRRVETFRDARDTSDNTTLDQRGDEALLESARTAAWNVDVIDTPGMNWPDAYAVGDLVTVLTESVAVTDQVVAVELTYDEAGETVRPILGSSELADNSPDIYATVRRLRQRLDALERRR